MQTSFRVFAVIELYAAVYSHAGRCSTQARPHSILAVLFHALLQLTLCVCCHQSASSMKTDDGFVERSSLASSLTSEIPAGHCGQRLDVRALRPWKSMEWQKAWSPGSWCWPWGSCRSIVDIKNVTNKIVEMLRHGGHCMLSCTHWGRKLEKHMGIFEDYRKLDTLVRYPRNWWYTVGLAIGGTCNRRQKSECLALFCDRRKHRQSHRVAQKWER